jgi:hypothetical protein
MVHEVPIDTGGDVLFLANQDARSATHELQLTPARRELDALKGARARALPNQTQP